MADEIALHVNFDDDCRFMVSISKSKPLADLRDEIEVVARELFPNRQRGKKVVCLESLSGSLLPDRYTVGQLLRDGNIVCAFSSENSQHRGRKRKCQKEANAKRLRRSKFPMVKDHRYSSSDSDDSESDEERLPENVNGKGGTGFCEVSNDVSDQNSRGRGLSDAGQKRISHKHKIVVYSAKKSRVGNGNEEISGSQFTAVVAKITSSHSEEISLTDTSEEHEAAVAENTEGMDEPADNNKDRTNEDKDTRASQDSDASRVGSDCSSKGKDVTAKHCETSAPGTVPLKSKGGKMSQSANADGIDSSSKYEILLLKDGNVDKKFESGTKGSGPKNSDNDEDTDSSDSSRSGKMPAGNTARNTEEKKNTKQKINTKSGSEASAFSSDGSISFSDYEGEVVQQSNAKSMVKKAMNQKRTEEQADSTVLADKTSADCKKAKDHISDECTPAEKVGEEIVASQEQDGFSEERIDVASHSKTQLNYEESGPPPNTTKITRTAGEERPKRTDRSGKSLKGLNSQLIPLRACEGIVLRSRRKLPILQDFVPSSQLSDLESAAEVPNEKLGGLKGLESGTEQAKAKESEGAVECSLNKELKAKDTTPVKPGTCASFKEAIRSVSEYKKLFGTPLCQHPSRRKAIEKSVQKVAAWLVTSRKDDLTEDFVDTGDNEKGNQEQTDDPSREPMPSETEKKCEDSGGEEEANVLGNEERRQDQPSTATPSDKGRTGPRTGQPTHQRSDGKQGEPSPAKSKASDTKSKGNKLGNGSEKGGGESTGNTTRVEGSEFIMPSPVKSDGRRKKARQPGSWKSVEARREGATSCGVEVARSRSSASASPSPSETGREKDEEDGEGRSTKEAKETKQRSRLEEGVEGEEGMQTGSTKDAAQEDEQDGKKKKKKKKRKKEKYEERVDTTEEEERIVNDRITKKLSYKETARKKKKHREGTETTVNKADATPQKVETDTAKNSGEHSVSSRRKRDEKEKKKGTVERIEKEMNGKGEEQGILNGEEETPVNTTRNVNRKDPKNTEKKGGKVASETTRKETHDAEEQDNEEAGTPSIRIKKEKKKKTPREGKSEKEANGDERFEELAGSVEGTQSNTAKSLGETDEKGRKKKRKKKAAMVTAGKETKEEENSNARDDIQTEVSMSQNDVAETKKEKKKKKRKEKTREEEENESVGDFQSNTTERLRENDEIGDSANKRKAKKAKKNKKKKDDEQGVSEAGEDIEKRENYKDAGRKSEKSRNSKAVTPERTITEKKKEKSRNSKAVTPERTITEKKSKKRRKLEVSNELSAKKRKESEDLRSTGRKNQSNVDMETVVADKRTNQNRNPASGKLCPDGSVVEDSGYDGEVSREISYEMYKRPRDRLIRTEWQGAGLHSGKGHKEGSGAKSRTKQSESAILFSASSSSSEKDLGIPEIITRTASKLKTKEKTPIRGSSTKPGLSTSLMDLIADEADGHVVGASGKRSLQTPTLGRTRMRLFQETPQGFTVTAKKSLQKQAKPSTAVNSRRKNRIGSTLKPEQRGLTPQEKEIVSTRVNLQTLLDEESFWKE